MITEDYVSFETAKLLKEKGFKTPVETGYYGDGRICHNLALDFMDYNHEDGYYSRPTIQMVMKWLREVHKLYVNIWADPKDVENNDFDIIFRAQVYNGTSNYGTYEFSTYEQAVEAAIKYCLENLIK